MGGGGKTNLLDLDRARGLGYYLYFWYLDGDVVRDGGGNELQGYLEE